MVQYLPVQLYYCYYHCGAIIVFYYYYNNTALGPNHSINRTTYVYSIVSRVNSLKSRHRYKSATAASVVVGTYAHNEKYLTKVIDK